MPGRHGYSTQGGWAQGGNGFSGVPATLSLSSRVSNTPAEYRASESIEFVPGFESGSGDSFETFITQESGSTGSGNGGVYAGGGYRYGFNGKENDNEVKGEGGQQDYGMRIYDPRLGRFLSVDPLDEEYPYYSPYHFAGNTPLQAIDLDGTEPAYSYFENGRRVYMPAGDNLPRRVPAEHAQFIPRVISTGGGGTGTSLALDLLPGIGQGKAVGELFTGEDYITKRELSWGERLWGLVPYLGKFAKGTKVAKALYATKKVSDVEVEVIKTTARANGAKNKVEKNLQAAQEKVLSNAQSSATKNRVTLRKATVEKIKENQPVNAEGQMIDPNTKQLLDPARTDIGHKPGNEWKRRKEMHEQKGSTRKEVIEAENNPDLYQLEDRSSNRSHKFEKKAN